MPLLAKQTEIHPDDLFALDAERFPWQVVHVRSRQEKKLARQLLDRDVAFYLPQIEQRKKRSGRIFISHLPVFPGYVFLRGGQPARDAAMKSNVVVRIIDVDDQQLLAAELRQIRNLQLRGASLRPHVDFILGEVVRICGGAFDGYRGIVAREKGHDRLIVQLSLLQKSVTVEFERDVIARAR